MRRGTTPTLKLVTDGIVWEDFDEVIVTIEEENVVELSFTGDRLTIEGSIVYVTLTQEETLQFNKKARVQIKGKKDGRVEATDLINIKVLPILNEEVM